MKLFNREPKPVTYIGPAVPSVRRTVTKTLLAGIGLGGAAVGAVAAGVPAAITATVVSAGVVATGIGIGCDSKLRKEAKIHPPKPKSTHPFA